VEQNPPKGIKMADEETKVEETTEAPAEEIVGGNDNQEDKKEKAEEVKEVKEVKEETASSAVEKAAPSGKFKDMIKEIESMTVSDLAELVKALEERFGVSASAPMMMAGAGAGAGAAAAEVEEKTSYTVLLKDGGAQKIAVIKAVREINQELGLKEAKDLVDGAPKEIKKDIPKADAEEAKKKLEAAGATVELI
jgi:large subunit ribosomal protein L7/L12